MARTLPFRLFVRALHNVAQQHIAHDHIVHQDGRNGLQQPGMARVNPGLALPPRTQAGRLVAVAAAKLPLRRLANQAAVGGQLLRIGENVHPPFIKDDRAQAGQLIKIPQQNQQLLLIKNDAQRVSPLSLFFPIVAAACSAVNL